MLKIVVTNVYSKLEFVSPDSKDQLAVQTLSEKLKLFDKNARFSELYNTFGKDGKRIWDGYVKFFNLKNFTFFTGHLPYVRAILDSIDTKYTIDTTLTNNHINVKPKSIYKFNGIELRPYQREGLDIAVHKVNRGVFYQATNSGKTILAIGICEAIPVKTLFLVDRVELLTQTYKKFKQYSNREVGVITSQDFEPREITIGMQKTIWSKLKNKHTKEDMLEYLNSIELIFSDECHKASSKTWRDVLKNMHRAYYRYGLSGTPLLEDKIRNMYLTGLIGQVVQRVTNKNLIDWGYSANPYITIAGYKTDKIPSSLDYGDVYKIGVVQNNVRNKMIVDFIKQNKGKSVLIIVKHIEHGKIIKDLLAQEDGYFISGQDTKYERIHIYNNFSNKSIPIVIASMIYKEGIDISAIDVLIYAAGEKAPVTILQVLGRGLRTRKDKSTLLFYDFQDVAHKHLRDHTKKRLAIYQQEGFELEYITGDHNGTI